MNLYLGMEELGVWDLHMNFVIEQGEVLLMAGTEETTVKIK